MIADLLIDLATLDPSIKHLAAGVMRDVLVIRDLEAMSARIRRAEHDAAVAVIQAEIDCYRDRIADLEIDRDFRRLEADNE